MDIREHEPTEAREEDGANRQATQEEVAVAVATASRYAEDVCKTWLSRVYGKPVAELFPGSPLVGYTAHIKFEPTVQSDATASFTLELAVVDSTYSLDTKTCGNAEPAVRREVARLLQAAHLYTKWLVAEYMPDHMGWLERAIAPGLGGTIYLIGTPPGTPQVGVVIGGGTPSPSA